jgi:glycerate 2-kinase
VKVVVAPDGFGGTLSAREAADAIATGWASARPDDTVVTVPMSDGGEGLLDAVAGPDDTWHVTEVAGPLGHPIDASFVLRPDGVAVVESALACGLALVPPERRTPMHTTTYGVGQLLEAARQAGARRILVGLGGSSTNDGGAGALSGLGFRLRVADGSGLKIGGDDLHRISSIERGWSDDWTGVEVELLSDVTTTLKDAAVRFGPQKGATDEDIRELTSALATWADVVERDLVSGEVLRDEPGTGAAGGLGYGLAAAIGARFRPGNAAVAELVGLHDALAGADVVVTGEGRLDATTAEGKVVAYVAEQARVRELPVLAVVGQHAEDAPALDDVEAASPEGPGPDPTEDVRTAAARLASRR